MAVFRDHSIDKEPLRWKNLNEEQRGAADAILQEHFTSLPGKMTATADSLEKQAAASPKASSATTKRVKANRLRAVAETAPSRQISLDQAAANRVSQVEKAATTHRMPGEQIAGAGWYFDAHKEMSDQGHSPRVMEASSALSPRSDPDRERAAASGLASSREGTVRMTRGLVSHLKKSGVEIPAEQHGTHVPFGSLPGKAVAAMADPTVRSTVTRHSKGIDWGGITQVSNPNNIAKAHDILGDPNLTAQDPHKAPKTWSYSHRLANAVPGTDEHTEYMLRASDLGSKIRGEVPVGQQMIDYVGLRHSNEGNLSNDTHTAEDSWQHAITVNHSDPKGFKATGDVTPGKKAHDGVSVSKDARVGPSAVTHAWHNEATHRASQQLESKYQTEYTVPMMLTQETGWTAARRSSQTMSGRVQDPEYAKHLKSQQFHAPEPKKPEGTQMGLF